MNEQKTLDYARIAQAIGYITVSYTHLETMVDPSFPIQNVTSFPSTGM